MTDTAMLYGLAALSISLGVGLVVLIGLCVKDFFKGFENDLLRERRGY